ncbi:hypothetical protein [Romboutsia hominis]|uniref:hypothetical protein n=1 Tax=Romboutsia hominis TaxID=1507512 RepID=UPI001F058CB8|nr:hypothetical protein [Romboutsia hominis]MCH1959496.1 hypothetical protein [Romboutsia hominis]
MDKIEFDKLDIQQQVEYINKGLKTKSAVKVCEEIGINESTLRTRFTSNGYKREGKQFIYTGIVPLKKPTKKKLVKNIEKKMEKYIETDTKQQNKNNKSRDIQALENRIENLETQIKSIMNIINTTNTINTVDTTELKKYKGATESRNYRINKEIQQEFKLLCNKFTAGTEYTVTDIISLALEDFINKYK